MTDDQVLVVLAEGEVVGEVARSRTGRLAFDYDDGWRRRRGATPLSLSMPLAAQHHPQRVVEPFLWGVLPDNEAVLARWGRELGVSVTHPFGLLSHVGEDLPGAMQLVRADRVADLTGSGDGPNVAWLDDDDVARALRTVRSDHTAWRAAGSGRWSLAGAQAKIALLWDGERWGRPAGRTPTTHILKPAITGIDDHDLNEHLCLRAAEMLGLRTARSEVVGFDDQRAIVVERYDRRALPDGTIRRIHQEDMCQALAVHPAAKYQSDGGPSAKDIVRVLRDNVDHRAAPAAVDGFVGALAFNWLVAGTDAHAKNYAVLLAGAQVRLAPFYDIASVLPYDDFHIPKAKLAMKIGGHYRLSSVGRGAWERLAAELRLPVDAVTSRVAAMAGAVADAFAAAAADEGVTSLRSPLPARLTDAVAERAGACARSLTASHAG